MKRNKNKEGDGNCCGGLGFRVRVRVQGFVPQTQ
jgi:hypothetical protein